MANKTLIAIDPSINYCGVAVFDMKSKEPIDALLIKPHQIVKRDGEFYDKAYSVFNQVDALRKKHKVVAVACELPDHWAVAGHNAREAGSITKLAFMCGLFYRMRTDVDKFIFALPREWKGQLSKEVMRNRLEPHYVKKIKYCTKDEWANINHNVADAIGIGHWCLYGRV